MYVALNFVRSCQEKFPGTEAFKAGPSLAGKLYELAEKKKEKKHRELWSKAVQSRPGPSRAFHLRHLHLLRLGTLEMVVLERTKPWLAHSKQLTSTYHVAKYKDVH